MLHTPENERPIYIQHSRLCSNGKHQLLLTHRLASPTPESVWNPHHLELRLCMHMLLKDNNDALEHTYEQDLASSLGEVQYHELESICSASSLSNPEICPELHFSTFLPLTPPVRRHFY